ncbi:MAG: HNH endonuclease, partial [Actinobacteria bacterium]|nr:HNH endonuclease [Actinomycetota bacterium]
CVDCGAIFAFERDHANPRANRGETSYANMEPRCSPCHRKKTEEDRKAGLLGPHARKPRTRREGGARAGEPRATRPDRARAP